MLIKKSTYELELLKAFQSGRDSRKLGEKDDDKALDQFATNRNFSIKRLPMPKGVVGTGMTRCILRPEISLTGQDLLAALLINGEYADHNSHFTDVQIYEALFKCANLIPFLPDAHIVGMPVKPLSHRQNYCSNYAISLIMRNKYNHALHEFQDCIDDYGEGVNRIITADEYTLYSNIITCFMLRLEEQTENPEILKQFTKKSSELLTFMEV